MRVKSRRNKIRQIRSAIHDGNPLAMDVRALGAIESALNGGDMAAIKAALSFGDEVKPTMQVTGGVAVIPVRGVLRDEVDFMVRYLGASSYQLIERDLKAAIKNSDVKSILFYHDSPGGSAVGVKRLADAIYNARGSKPIVAYVQGTCGSASYYLAAACDQIKATADSMVGSIGTILTHEEGSKFFSDMGVTHTVITNKDSPKKGHGNIYETLTPEAKATIQSMVESYGESFIADVARYRNLTPQQVASDYGQGDAMRADVAIKSGMIDAVVANFQEAFEPLASGASSSPVQETESDETPVVTGSFFGVEIDMKISKKIRAQLFALDLIDSPDASDETCSVAMKAWFRGKVPENESDVLAGLRESSPQSVATAVSEDGTPKPQQGSEQPTSSNPADPPKPPENVAKAHDAEMGEARLADLKASADLVNQAAGRKAITADMVIEAFEAKQKPSDAMKAWNKSLAEQEPAAPSSRTNVTGEGADQYAKDVVDALVYRSSDNPGMELSNGASALVNRPLWAVAGECLKLAGQDVDMYGSRELLAEQAMQMGNATQRSTFFSGNEDRRYLQNAGGGPFNRPGDFPNILSGLANKFLDTIQLDDDYSYPEISAVLPGGLNDFKPAMMMNKGIVEEMDEVQNAEAFKELGLDEEVLSYIFIRRFGNKFGWTPVMVANDDLNAFAEGMIGLAEAWQVTQNRLVVDRFTANEDLLDGSALFANRADTGTGTNPAANNNDRTSGDPPSDAEWEAMEVLYADIGGIATGRRVRGTLNTIFCPTGAVTHEATRYFANLGLVGESKQAATTSNVGLFRGKIRIVPESELRVNSSAVYYGLRNPTRLNTATVVRGYFNGFGTAGRRERWYDPTNKTTYVSLEGRMGVAVKNWRYAVRNAGTGA